MAEGTWFDTDAMLKRAAIQTKDDSAVFCEVLIGGAPHGFSVFGETLLLQVIPEGECGRDGKVKYADTDLIVSFSRPGCDRAAAIAIRRRHVGVAADALEAMARCLRKHAPAPVLCDGVSTKEASL